MQGAPHDQGRTLAWSCRCRLKNYIYESFFHDNMVIFLFNIIHDDSVTFNLREGLKKSGNFPLWGGAFIFDIFSHFQKLISKHALNHVPSDAPPPAFSHK